MPGEWHAWGEPLDDDAGIWIFDHAADDLADLLDRLLLTLPETARAGVLALELDDPTAALPMVELLRRLTPMEALHARIHHSWINGELNDGICSDIQPIVDLNQTGRIFAYEALCRVDLGAAGRLGGGEAFSIARRAGRLTDFDLVCQASALSVKKRLLPQGMPIFINAMPNSLLQSDFAAHPSFGLMQDLGVPPHEVVIEVVESEQVEDPEALATACDRLKAMGFRIALDDIGSGYSGLNLLATLRPDFVKIDRALVHGVHNSRMRVGVLEALISMAQRLGCVSIAEGLENVEDVELCRDLGVGYAQGYYFARPMPGLADAAALPVLSQGRNRQMRPLVRLGDFLSHGETVSIGAEMVAARQAFMRNTALEHIIVLEQGRPLGFLSRRILTAPAWEAVGRHIHPLEQILSARVNAHSLLRRLYETGGRAQPWVVVDDNGRYMGTLVLLGVLDHLLNVRLPPSVHPLSGLPTGPVLRSLIEQRLAGGEALQLVYLDLDHFKAFNDRYGFVRGDAMIKVLAEILRKGFDGLPEAELGHIGGDDFLLVAPARAPGLDARLRWLIDRFHELAPHLYDESDLDLGYFGTQDGQYHPVATLSVVVVNGRTGPMSDSVMASTRAAQLKRAAKDRLGSVIVTEGTPPVVTEMPRVLGLAAWRHALENALATFPHTGDADAVDQWFGRYSAFELVFRLDARGIQQGANWLNPGMRGLIKRGGEGMNRADRTYFRELRRGQRSYLSSIYVSRATEDFCISLALPRWHANGTLAEVMVGDINLVSLVGLAAESHDGGGPLPIMGSETTA
ncbi:EAL domain-containing protein [Acidihalobacter prosperus]|uniref:EAL domain-containing protein n=1 Tax=Acidihalobacter prosperus TaxID=160660 RepID=A0A1A6C8Q1_9GAMM|nr:EAL domain-containing protein [Acidihalobacter prosperus]OBS10924.1 EAL domain-containing protein [Acidihalobacter prosperus]